MSERRLRELERKADRLMRRILQLDGLLCKDAVLDEERARALKEQIRRRQCELEDLYAELDLTRDEA
jgi:hypothetical protein